MNVRERRERVEQAAIATAESYREANGGDHVAAGLMLAGMVVGASLDQAARRELIAGYLEQQPGEVPALIGRWASLINQAATA